MAKRRKPIIDMVDFKALRLDNQKNPRLPARLEGCSDREILEYMILEGNALELMGSIGQKGYFQGEPLLVVAADGSGNFTVIEGNRRLSAVMLLTNPSLATVKRESVKKVVDGAEIRPKKIPVIVYGSRDEILDYLGYRHITGVKAWDSLAKAKYLRQLYYRSSEADLDTKCLELARTIGSRSDYVRKLLCSLSVFDAMRDEAYFGVKGLDQESVSFSLITTALGYNNIQKFLGLESGEDISAEKLNIPNLKDLTKWIFDKKEGKTRLGESRNLSQLASVVANEVALNEFKDGQSLKTAFLLSEGAKEAVTKAIWDASNKLDLAYNYVRDVSLELGELKQLDHISKTALAIRKLATPEPNDGA